MGFTFDFLSQTLFHKDTIKTVRIQQTMELILMG